MANGEDKRTIPSDNIMDYFPKDREISLVVSGSDKVYVGEVPSYSGGGISYYPKYEDRFKATQEGFRAITQDRDLYNQMSQAYNIFNNKPINAKVAPDDLERFYADANYEASQRDPVDKVSALDVIFGRLPSAEVIGELQADAAGRGRGGYSGPQRTITEMAESDIQKLANTIAIDLIGRPVDSKEMNRIVQKMRRAEQEQPTVTTSVPGRTVTQQGLTAQGREDILREVISQNPEYERFQVDTTVMDSMLDFVNKKKQVSGG